MKTKKMFCNNCGTQFDDTQAFCPNCGTAVEAANNAASPQPFAPKKGGNSKLIPLIGVAAVAVILIIVIVAIASSGGYKKAIKNQFKYLEKGKVEKLYALTAPEAVREDSVDESYELDLDEYYEIMTAASEAFWEGLKDEGKVKLDYEIKAAENLDDLDELKKDMKDDWEIKDLDDFIDGMDELYEEYDFDADEIKKAYAVEYKYTLEVDGDKAISKKDIAIVYKYEGDWYIYSGLNPLSLAYQLDEEDYEDVIEDVQKELEDLYE